MLTFGSDMEASKKIFGMHCTSDFAILGGLQLISATESYHWWDVPLSPLHARSIKISQFSTTRCNTCRGRSAHREVRDRCFLQIIIYIYLIYIKYIPCFETRIWETACVIPVELLGLTTRKAPGFAVPGPEPESDVEDVADDLARELLGEYMSGETWTYQSVVPYVLDISQNMSQLTYVNIYNLKNQGIHMYGL